MFCSYFIVIFVQLSKITIKFYIIYLKKIYSSTGIVSSCPTKFQISVLVCNGKFWSVLISSKILILKAALKAGEFSFLYIIFLISSAERLMFFGTESSLTIRSTTSVHCFIIFSESIGILILS